MSIEDAEDAAYRTKQVRLALTQEEGGQLKRWAATAGMSVGDLVFVVGVMGGPVVPHENLVFDLQLARAAANLTQVEDHLVARLMDGVDATELRAGLVRARARLDGVRSVLTAGRTASAGEGT